MTVFITGNGIHTANMTSSASRNFGSPNFMPHVHAILGPLSFAALFASCLLGAFMLIKAVVHILVQAISQHPQAGPPPAPAPRPTCCPSCSSPHIYADYEEVVHSLIASGDCMESRPAYWAARLEAAIEAYSAGKASADGKHRFAGIVFVVDSSIGVDSLIGSPGDDMGSEGEIIGGSTGADISASGAADVGDTGSEESPSSSDMYSGTLLDDESRLIEAIRKTALPVQPLSSPRYVPYSGLENRGY